MSAMKAPRLFAGVLIVASLAACSEESGDPGSGGSTSAPASTSVTSTSTTSGASSVSSSSTGIDPRFEPLMEAIEKERVELGAPGVAVAVIEDGKVTFAQGFGSKDPSAEDPVLPTTLFRIGSVNKMLTAAAVLSQVAKGNVDLDAPVTTYVPGFHFNLDASWASSIRVEHLLAQTSGISEDLEVDVPAAQQTDAALETFMTGAFANRDYLMVAPGTLWNYSNPNFYLAGLVAEKTSGKPYRQLMKEDVFTPLGMDRTFFLGSEVLADGDYAIGKASYPGIPARVLPDTYENAWARPAGYATSSVYDLAKFVAFLLDGNPAVMPKALSDDMQAPKVDTMLLTDLYKYAYGLFVEDGFFDFENGGDFYRIQLVEHGGDIPGFAADVAFLPSLRFGFVALSNADLAHFEDSRNVAFTTLAGLPAKSAPPALAFDPATLPSFVGTYDDPYNIGEMIVTQAGSGLEISLPDVDAAGVAYQHQLDAIEGNNFVMNIQGTDVQLTFVPDPDGIKRWARTRFFVAARPEAPVQPAATPRPPTAHPRTTPAALTPAERRARIERALSSARLR